MPASFPLPEMVAEVASIVPELPKEDLEEVSTHNARDFPVAKVV